MTPQMTETISLNRFPVGFFQTLDIALHTRNTHLDCRCDPVLRFYILPCLNNAFPQLI